MTEEKFLTQIDKFVINSEARMLAVARTAISNVVDDMQTPVAKGGRMRVKTGFLRASAVANLNSMPSGESRPVRGGVYVYDGSPVNAALARMKIGDIFYFGWIARYAKYRELHDGFLETAVQKWQSHVDRAVAVFRNKDMS